MNPDELKRVRELLPEAVLRLIDENTRLKTRIMAFETALRTFSQSCPVQACEGDWDPLRELLGERPPR